jgi:uncharacterized membrane protein YuzA (DUF378 family)
MKDWKAYVNDIELMRTSAIIVLVVTGLNMGLYGIFNSSLLYVIFGEVLSRLFFVISGVAAGYLVYLKYGKKVTP